MYHQWETVPNGSGWNFGTFRYSVPGGWIYVIATGQGISQVFVPRI